MTGAEFSSADGKVDARHGMREAGYVDDARLIKRGAAHGRDADRQILRGNRAAQCGAPEQSKIAHPMPADWARLAARNSRAAIIRKVRNADL